jgi:serine/threonine-protein kinase
MTIDNVLRVDAPSLRELNPLVPVDIERVVLSMLEKNPANRLKSGLELNAELVKILGPAAGQATTSAFAVEIMDSPMAEKQLPAGELITVIAARPITAWLQRVSDSSDGIHYENLLPEPTPASTGGTFFPSTPEASTTSKTGELNDLRDEIVGPSRGRPMLLAAAATGLTAIALVVALLIGGGDAPDEDKVVMPTPPTTRTDDKTNPPPKAKDDAPATKDTAAPATALLKAQADAGPVTTEPAVDEPAEATKPTPTPRRPSGRSLTVKAPARIIWLNSRGKRIGKGSGRVTVRPSEKFVTALDGASGLRTRMTVADSLDYAKLPKGRLSVRVRPWAKVFLGRKLLGTTPLDTVTVVAGTYKVRLEQDEKKTSRTIEVKPGGHAVVKVDMRKE